MLFRLICLLFGHNYEPRPLLKDFEWQEVCVCCGDTRTCQCRSCKE